MNAHQRSALARAALMVAGVVATMLALAPAASGDLRDFSLRFSETARGNTAFAANTLIDCPASEASCVVGGQSANFVPNANNNSRAGRWIDVDGVAETNNSSRARLTMPEGANVLFAGLYWSGRVQPSDDTDPDAVENFLSPLLRIASVAGYQPVTGTQFDSHLEAAGVGYWSGFADVTDLVQTGGSGVYTFAFEDSPMRSVGTHNQAGWTLWVAYEHPSEPSRNLSIFDGLVFVGETQDIEVSGFATPPAGDFDVAVGVSSLEGDANFLGDTMRVNGVDLFDALTPANNFFNSRITRFGADQGGRDPNYPNQLGYDTKLIDATAVDPNIIANGDRGATVTVTSADEGYLPTVIATAIEGQDLAVTKAVQNVDRPEASDAFPGEALEYTLTVENVSNEASHIAEDVVLTDAMPAGTTYVPGSLEMVSGNPPPTGSRTDADGDDSAEFDGGGNAAVFRLGEGANATSGGEIDPGETVTLSFQVTVNPDFPGGESVFNDALVDYVAATSGDPLQITSNEVETPVVVPPTPPTDLSLEKAGDAVVDPGGAVSWTLTVRNDGPADSAGSTVTDTLPAGVTNVQAPGCDVAGQMVTCDVGPLAANGSTEFTITGTAPDTPATCFENAASVAADGLDPDSANNEATARTCTTPATDLGIEKVSDPTVVDPGGQFTYTITVTNDGPNDATDVVVTDTLPDGLTNVQLPAGCQQQGQTVTCTVGPVAASGQALIVITANAPDTPSTCLDNAASVEGAEGDPDLADNETTARTCTTPAADLELEKSAPATVVRGDEIVWTLTVTNLGPNDSSGSTVTDTLPGGLSNVEAPGCDVQGGTVTCDVGPLAVDESTEITISGDAPSTTSVCLTNAASLEGAEGDPVLENNESAAESCTVPPRGKPKLALRKSTRKRTVHPGEVIPYKITVRNKGKAPARGVKVCDKLPSGLQLMKAPGAKGSSKHCWRIKRLAPGRKKTLRVVARVKQSAGEGRLTNRATAKGRKTKRKKAKEGVRVERETGGCKAVAFKRC